MSSIKETEISRTTISELKKFGFVLSAVVFALGIIFSFKHKAVYIWPFALSVLFFITSIIFPICLKPIHWILMRISFAIGWANTKILLFLTFYLVITPIGLMMRIFGKDLLNQKIGHNKSSYWIKREEVPFEKSRYEQLF